MVSCKWPKSQFSTYFFLSGTALTLEVCPHTHKHTDTHQPKPCTSFYMLPNFVAASGLLIPEDKFLYNCCTFLSNLTASCLLCKEALKLLPSGVRCLLSLILGRLKDQFGAWRFLISSLEVLSCQVKKLERPHRGRGTSETEREHGEIRPS